MSTLTPRMGLIKPDPADVMRNWDAENGQAWDKVDLFYGARAVTNVGTAIFLGEIVKETSSSKLKRWNGSKWEIIGSFDQAAGTYKGSNAESGTVSVTTGETILLDNPGIDCVLGRTYRIIFSMQIEWNSDTGSGNVHVLLRGQPNNGAVTPASTRFKQWGYNIDSQSVIANPVTGVHYYHHNLASTTMHFGLFGVADSNQDFHINAAPGSGGGLKPSTQFLVHDIGLG